MMMEKSDEDEDEEKDGIVWKPIVYSAIDVYYHHTYSFNLMERGTGVTCCMNSAACMIEYITYTIM